MALLGSYTFSDSQLTLPQAYIRLENASLDRSANGSYILTVRLAVYANAQAANSGSTPVNVVILSLPVSSGLQAALQNYLTALYTAVKTQQPFTQMTDVL